MSTPEELTLMRIFIGENDRCQHRPLYQVLIELLCREGLAGATAIKGCMGFGAHSRVHSDRYLRLSSGLPVVIEVIDEQARIDAVLPQLEDLFQGGLITMEKVQVIRFRDGGGAR